MISKEGEEDCPITVDCWLGFLNSENNIRFYITLSLLVILLALYKVIYTFLLYLSVMIWFLAFICCCWLLMLSVEICHIQRIKSKIIRGLGDTNKIREEWKNFRRNLRKYEFFMFKILLPVFYVFYGIYSIFLERCFLLAGFMLIIVGIVWLVIVFYYEIKENKNEKEMG